MTAVLLWKEYRQQRSLWLLIAALAVLLVVGVAAIMGQGSGLEAFRDRRIQSFLVGVVFVLVVVQGLATGALLLAADKEAGTLPFLDRLTGNRGSLFARKLLAGVLMTLAQSVFLAGLSWGLGFGSGEGLFTFPFLALDSLLWGLLAGAVCRTAMTALITGVLALGLSWCISLVIGELVWRPFDNLPGWTFWNPLRRDLFGLVAGFVAWRIYCRDDFSRQPRAGRLRTALLAALPSDWSVLLWLVCRQGRWVLLGCAAGIVIAAFAVPMAPLVVWPVGTLLLGLACGLAAFAPDQSAGSNFWGAQRFPPGRLWTVKVVFWAAVTGGVASLAWLILAVPMQSLNPAEWINRWSARVEGDGPRVHIWFGNPGILLVLWPLYGFAIGQFFGQVLQRPIIAMVLGASVSSVVAALWVPSLVVGGVPLWQVLTVAALLLVTTRLTQWPWVSGRLATTRCLVGVGAALTLTVFSLAGFLWHRAVQVPDVGEPFDMKAFVASLPKGERNQAGPLVRNAAEQLMLEYEGHVASKVPQSLMFTTGKAGWHVHAESTLGPWLDEIFQKKWVEDATIAAKLPLGLVWRTSTVDVAVEGAKGYRPPYEALARLFVAREMQLQARGDSQAGLNQVDTALGLSRQVANYSWGLYAWDSDRMEASALEGVQLWLQKVGPDKELLKAAQTMLQRHAAEWPPAANSIKATYYVYVMMDQQGGSRLGRQSRNLVERAYDVPWEKERRHRMVRAIVKGRLAALQEPAVANFREWRKKEFGEDATGRREVFLSWHAARLGLPPKEGPGADISRRQWGEWLEESLFNSSVFANLQLTVAYRSNLLALNACELAVALARYQAEHGNPPPKLHDLVPRFLTKLPHDSATGKDFKYAIYQGVNGEDDPWLPVGLQPGHAYFWSEDDTLTPYPVPVWDQAKKN